MCGFPFYRVREILGQFLVGRVIQEGGYLLFTVSGVEAYRGFAFISWKDGEMGIIF